MGSRNRNQNNKNGIISLANILYNCQRLFSINMVTRSFFKKMFKEKYNSKILLQAKYLNSSFYLGYSTKLISLKCT